MRRWPSGGTEDSVGAGIAEDDAVSEATPAELEARLGHPFRNPDLLTRALTHPSYAHEHPPAPHNEAFAFLGDAVVGLVAAELLLAQAPHDGAGPLTQRRAALVSAASLAAWAVRLGLPAHLYLGRGEEQGGGRAKESILASALEAVVGAVYLDGGLAPATAVIARLMEDARSL
jgi:ribonuclease-3